MKPTVLFSTLAALLCWASSLMAQVAVEKVPDPILPPANNVVPAPANNLVPAPAAPVAPTPGGERRAVRREERRIDRNDPNGTLAPAIQPNGAVTATPNLGGGVAAAPMPASPEQWRYRNQNGQWLYYTPSNAWVSWNGTSWGAYTPGAGVTAPVPPTAPVNGAYTTNYRGPNQNYNYNRPYRRGWFGRRYYY